MTIVFLDLDGTVVGSGGGVSDRVLQAISDARSAGIAFHVCTGRTCAGVARDIAEAINPGAFHIFDSGAVAMTPADRRVLFAEPLDRGDLQVLVDHARTGDALLELYTTDGVFAERATDDGVAHSECLNMPFTVLDFDTVLATQTVIRGHWIARDDTFERALNVSLPRSYTATAGSPALPQMRFASVTRDGVTKGDAVRRILEQANVDRERVYAIGDTMGDLSMLQAVANPLVMANADKPLLEMFDTVPSIDADGVAIFLESLLASS